MKLNDCRLIFNIHSIIGLFHVSAGLLEKPVLIEDGKKRERKKVERITFETTKPSSGLQIKEGKGRSLGDIPFSEY